MDKIFPPTAKRVQLHTNKIINEEIHERTIKNINELAKTDKAKISEKIRNLELEWDTERVLETNASVIILLSILLGFFLNRWWFLLSSVVAFFLLQHALQGWCPPLPIIRRLGVRTSGEIDYEKTMLKLIRGDFKDFTEEAKLDRSDSSN